MHVHTNEISPEKPYEINDEGDDEKVQSCGFKIQSKIAAIFRRVPEPVRIIRQARRIHQTQNEKNFRIHVDLITCVHGYLSSDKSQAASLMVFEAQFVCLTKRGAFNRVKMDVDFLTASSEDKALQPSHFNIISHAPFLREEQEKRTTKEIRRTTENEVKATTKLDMKWGHAGVEVKKGEKTESNFTDIYYGKGTSSIQEDQNGDRSGVWWNIKGSNNPDSKDDAGIKPNYRFAVLLTRSNNDPFTARLKLLVDAGWRFRAENRLSQVKNIKGTSPSLTFSPEIWYEGNVEGIDRKRLAKFAKEGKLARLTTLS